MAEAREKTETTLKNDYNDIDKRFKNQLITTKVSETAFLSEIKCGYH